MSGPARDPFPHKRDLGTLCPHCGKRAPMVASFHEDPPGAGDTYMCLGCCEPSLFTGSGGELRRPDSDEAAALRDDPDIARIVRACRRSKQ